MINITLKQLEIFVAIVETGSFTKAANRLYMAQSTVSGHIRTLEKELGVLLFRRDSKRNIQISEIGRRIYKSSQGILASCHALQDDIIIDKTNELTIGASTVPATCILPRILANFAQIHPEARFTVKKGDSAIMHQMLSEGELQVAFVGSNIQHHAFQYDKIAEDYTVLIAPKREPYLTYKKQNRYGKEFLTHPLLFREPGSGTQKVVDEYISHIGLEKNKLNIVGRFEDSGAIMDMVSRGLGLSLISELLVDNSSNNNQIIKFDLDKDKNLASRSYYMLTRKNIEFSDIHLAFVDFIKESLENKPK